MFPAFIGNIGSTEIIVILIIALLLFGRRLPEVGRSLGKGIVEFKKGVRGIEDDIKDDMDKVDRDIERIPAARSGSTVDTSSTKEKETAPPTSGD